MKKRLPQLVISLVAIFFAAVLLHYGNTGITGFAFSPQADISACGTVNESSNLTSNVDSNGSCLSITVDNVILDCKGFNITFGRDGGSTRRGITAANRNNITIRNCNIYDVNETGSTHTGILVDGTASNIFIINNTINVSGTGSNTNGIDADDDGQNFTIANNTINISGNGRGIRLQKTYSILQNNSISINSSLGSDAIIIEAAQNVTLLNNQLFVGSSQAKGVESTGASGNFTFIGNLVRTGLTGGATNTGLVLAGSNNRILHNTINVNGGGISPGITTGSGANILIFNNTITTNGTGQNGGIGLGATNSTVDRNNIITNSQNLGAHGITVSGDHNNITNNNISSGIDNRDFGIRLSAASNNRFINNTITTNGDSFGNDGIFVSSASSNHNIFINTTISTNGTVDNDGITLQDSNNFTFINTVISTRGSNSYAILFTSGTNHTFINTTLTNVNQWMSVASGITINFTDIAFNTSHGKVFYDFFQINTSANVNSQQFNITPNIIYLNSSNLTFLNTSAQVTLYNVSDPFQQPIVDLEDDGTFIYCPPPRCTGINFSNNELRYNVSSFTTYSSTIGGVNATLTKTDSPDPVTVGSNVAYTITFTVNNGTAFNTNITDFLPNGTNVTTLVGNLTSGQSSQVNITFQTSTTGTLNNTVTVFFTNASNGANNISVSELTTVSAAASSNPVPGGGGGGSSASNSVGLSVQQTTQQDQQLVQPLFANKPLTQPPPKPEPPMPEVAQTEQPVRVPPPAQQPTTPVVQQTEPIRSSTIPLSWFFYGITIMSLLGISITYYIRHHK